MTRALKSSPLGALAATAAPGSGEGTGHRLSEAGQP